MLWREAYDTRRLGDLPPFPLEGLRAGQALIVVGIAALPEFGIWSRLVENDFGTDAWRGILVGHSGPFEEALPPSRLARCLVAEAVDLPVVEGRVLAAVWTREALRSVMIGPATEEAWDEFSDAMRAARPEGSP